MIAPGVPFRSAWMSAQPVRLIVALSTITVAFTIGWSETLTAGVTFAPGVTLTVGVGVTFTPGVTLTVGVGVTFTAASSTLTFTVSVYEAFSRVCDGGP